MVFADAAFPMRVIFSPIPSAFFSELFFGRPALIFSAPGVVFWEGFHRIMGSAELLRNFAVRHLHMILLYKLDLLFGPESPSNSYHPIVPYEAPRKKPREGVPCENIFGMGTYLSNFRFWNFVEGRKQKSFLIGDDDLDRKSVV